MLKPFIGAACLCAAAISPAQAQTVRESTPAGRQAFMVVKVHDALNVRSGPSVRFGVINIFQSGTRVAITGDCRSMWCPVICRRSSPTRGPIQCSCVTIRTGWRRSSR